MSKFFHFTNEAGHTAIQNNRGILQPGGPLGLVWLTTIGVPVGSTMALLETPDKLEYRWEVEPIDYMHMIRWEHARKELPMELWWQHEARHSDPLLWYVSFEPVLATYSPSKYQPILKNKRLL